MSKFIKIKNEHTEAVISKLVDKYGLPRIYSNLSIYYRTSELTLEITFLNSSCYVRFYNPQLKVNKILIDYFESSPPIYVQNKNIKYLFKAISGLGLNKALVSSITKLDFTSSNDSIVSFQVGTLIGDLLTLDNEGLIQEFQDYYDEILDSKDIDEIINTLNIQPQEIFDKLGNINNLIREHAELYAVNLSFNDLTIGAALSFKSNDYSSLDKYFKYCVNNSLFAIESTEYKLNFLEPVSFVIPCYNSCESILKCLSSIQSQHIDHEFLQESVEVILVDDGSEERVIDYVDPSEFTFDLKIIRLEKNSGLSNARNVGAAIAKHDYLFFIDSDILLSENYIFEHLVRLKTVPGTIFMSLKHNIENDESIARIETISSGLKVPVNYNDKRLLKKQDKNDLWVNQIEIDGIFEILDETYYFTKFGNGRRINGFDLPSAVVGHNLSMTKIVFKEIGGFSNAFNGWGLEDTLFGATAISKGYFIVPVLSAGVYHINHPVRSLNETEKDREYKRNIEIYKRLIGNKI